MTNKEKAKEVLDFIRELFPNAHCELNYSKNYELVLAVMLSAQTTDKSVNNVTKVLFSKYDSLEKLSNADVKDIEEIIKPIGIYKGKAKRVSEASKMMLEYGDKPFSEEFLLTLPGVGIKTRNVVVAELYGAPYIAVDTHVSRIAKRLGFASENDEPIEIEEKLEKAISEEDRVYAHHGLIFFGRYFCKSKNPLCKECKLKKFCKDYKE